MIRLACPPVSRMLVLFSIVFFTGVSTVRAQADSLDDHKLTEIYSPVPPVVTPGSQPGAPPSDAVILFDGKNLDKWVSANDGTSPANWAVANDIMTVNKKRGISRQRNLFPTINYILNTGSPPISPAPTRPGVIAGFFLPARVMAMTGMSSRSWITIITRPMSTVR